MGKESGLTAIVSRGRSSRTLRIALGLALSGAACGGISEPSLQRAPARADEGVRLAALLPDHADRCVVSRPALVAERRRSLVLLHSLAEPSAWATDLRPVAYASAVAERPDGRRARRSYYRFADSADERVRDALGVRWLDEPCERSECQQPVARWLDERTLEVSRYEWPARTLPISTSACVELASMRADAIEIAVDASAHVGLMRLSAPRISRWVLHASRDSLERAREIVLGDPLEARVLESRLRERGLSEPALLPLGPSRQRVERHDDRVLVHESRLWEELELAVEDERLLIRASALERELSEPVPLARVRIRDLGAVRHQIGLRLARLPRLAAEERARAAADLATLLERAWEAHPGELPLARTLVRLALGTLDDPERARDVASSVLARGIEDRPEPWRALRREALSRIPGPELARALVDDGVAPEAEAARAAQDLRELNELGVTFEWAEGAWRTSRELFDAHGPRRAVDHRLPFEGALGALVGWARLGQAERHLTVQVAVRVPSDRGVRVIGDTRPELIAVRGAHAGTIYVGALASPDLVALRRLGAVLGGVLGSGSVELAVSMRDPNGVEVIRMRVAGVLSGDVLRLERVSTELGAARWALLTRYLAQPLADLPTALFPPPVLTVRAESEEMASELRRALDGAHPGACRLAGPVLRCRRPGRPEELGEVLLRLTSARIEVDRAAVRQGARDSRSP